jgi:peptidoglycan/LPS O-acetylase OafA/YrhL
MLAHVHLNTPHLKNRPEIDGLRAVAVLPVVCYHAGLGMPGGFVGVDVFFVISGYLISRLILRDLGKGQFAITEFWERRIRRILPAAFAMVCLTLLGCWFLYLPLDFADFGKTVIGQALLSSNLVLWKQSGYFAEPSELKPLLHTWSLAVEEQFYLLFPFLLLLLYRFARRSLAWVIFVLALVSFALGVVGTYQHPLATFYLLPTRAWELLIGACLAAFPRPLAVTRAHGVLGWVGLAAIVCSAGFYSDRTRFPGVAALLPCAGAALVIWANSAELTASGKLLAWRPLVFIGLISYSLYLVHWPIIVFVKYRTVEPLSPLAGGLICFASIVVAALSWRFIEGPFRRRIACPTRSEAFAFAICATAVMLFGGLSVARTGGFPSRVPLSARNYATGIADIGPIPEISLEQARAGEFAGIGPQDAGLPLDLLVWGDSHAMAVLPAIESLCAKHGVRAVAATHSSTPPLLGWVGGSSLGESIGLYNQAIVDYLRQHQIKNVLLVAYWNSLLTVNKATPETIHSRLRETVEALKQTGAHIWIMKQVPEQRWNIPRKAAMAALQNRDPAELGLSVAEHERTNEIHAAIFAGLASTNVTLLDPSTVFLDESSPGMLRATRNGRALYRDRTHLSTYGARFLAPLFEPIFAAKAKP